MPLKLDLPWPLLRARCVIVVNCLSVLRPPHADTLAGMFVGCRANMHGRPYRVRMIIYSLDDRAILILLWDTSAPPQPLASRRGKPMLFATPAAEREPTSSTNCACVSHFILLLLPPALFRTDAIRSILVSQQGLDTREIVVIHHVSVSSDCSSMIIV